MANATSAILKAVFADYGPAALLRDRTIVPAGFEFDFVDTGTPVQGMARMVRDLEFDAVDMSPTTYLAARSLGIPIVALPIAIYAHYPHTKLWTHKASNVRGPADLPGKNIGVRTWLNPANVWLRGMLAQEFGVELASANWTITVDDPIAAVPVPANAHRTSTEPRAFKLLEMVTSGEVDAVIDALTLHWHHAVKAGAVDPALVEPLFDDVAGYKAELYRRFGYVSVGHIVVVKEATLAAYPGAAAALYDTFVRAKTRYLEQLAAPDGIDRPNREPWLIARDRDNAELLACGIDPLPMGTDLVRTIDALMQILVKYRYIPQQLDTAAQFARV